MYCKNILFATPSFGEQPSQITRKFQSCAQYFADGVSANWLVMEYYGITKLAPSTSARILHYRSCDVLALALPLSQSALPMQYEPLESKRFDEY